MSRSLIVVLGIAGCGRIDFSTTQSDAQRGDGLPGDGPPLSAYSKEVLADTPIAYWRLDDASPTVALDRVGAHDGKYFNAPGLGFGGALPSEPASTAVNFAGPDDYLDVPDAPDLCLNNSWTLEMWVERTGAFSNGFPAVLSKGNSTMTGWVIYMNAADPRLTLKRAGIDGIDETVLVDTASFHFFAITYDKPAQHLQWYVDGVPDLVSDPIVFPDCTDTTSLRVGRDGPVINEANVAIDELALFATALPASRIATHYAKR